MSRSVWIVDAHASEADIRAGVEAAERVFLRWRLTPAHCYAQMIAHADGDAYGERGLAAWREAEVAAIAACCAGWRKIPEAAHLALA